MIEFHSGVPAYRQIMHRIQAAVAAGNLKHGDQLPTIRALCEKLGVNPNTVARAYRELAHAGVVEARQGSGSYVAPPAKAPPLSAKEKKIRLNALYDRIAAEASSHGIGLEELVRHIGKRKSHA